MIYDPTYEPRVTIIIPTNNEEEDIAKKLQNIQELEYPKKKMESIVVDSVSRNRTVDVVGQSIKKNSFPFKTLINCAHSW